MAQVQKLASLDPIIDSLTQNLSRKALNARLKKLAKASPANARTICDHILAEQTERNIKPSTIEGKMKVLIWLSEYHGNKQFEKMSKDDVLTYLNHLRRTPEQDPSQKWAVSYNGRVVILAKFYRWLFAKNEPDYRKRPVPPCMQGIKQLPRQEKSPYKPSDLWDAREHEVFLRYCPDTLDRCYHAMANDLSARPHELLNLKIKDLVFKITAEGIQYAEVLIKGGKTRPGTLPLISTRRLPTDRKKRKRGRWRLLPYCHKRQRQQATFSRTLRRGCMQPVKT